MILRICYIYIVVFIALMPFSINNSLGQELSVPNQRCLEIRNNLGISYKFTLKNKRDDHTEEMYLAPDETGNFDFTYSGRNLRNYYIMVTYDVECYKSDLKIIRDVYERKERDRRNNIITMALLRGLDDYLFKRKFFDFIDISTLIIKVINGKDIDQWTEDLTTGIVEGQMLDKIDDKLAKSIATSAFAMKQLLQNQNYPDLDKAVENCLEQLKTREQKRIELTDFIHRFPWYELSIESTIPLGNKYTYKESKEPQQGDYNTNLMPYSLRLTNHWTYNQEGLSFYLPVSFGQSPLLYKLNNPDQVYPFSEAKSFNHIDVCIGYNFRFIGKREIGLNLNFELGARGNFLNTYTYKSVNQQISNLKKEKYFDFDQVNPMINIGLSFDLKLLKLIGRYSATLSYTEEQNDMSSNLSAEYFQVGISVPLIKKYRFY